MFNGPARSLLLGRVLEEELFDLPHRQALGQIIKGTMFIAAVMAMAVGLAAAGKALDQRGAQRVRVDDELRRKGLFAAAQGERGFGGIVNPSHN